jgi:predicted PurR-regulated permease PerM
MKDFDHLMTVWQNQPVKEQLSVDEALKQVKKGMGSLSRKLMWGIVAMIVAIVNAFVILFFMVFQSWVTYVGILIMLVPMVIYVVMMLRDYRLIHRRDVTVNPTDYLQSLKEYKKNRAVLYGKLYYSYIILLSVGLALYFLEVLNDATLLGKIIVYSLTTIWFLICTFYLKERIVKNEEEKINLIVERLERLKDQFAV